MDLPTIQLIWKYGLYVSFFVICPWALWRGGFNERMVAAMFAASWGVGMVVARLENNRPGPISMTLDVIWMLSMIWLAIHARRPWVFFVAATHVMVVVVHMAVGWLRLSNYAYITALHLVGIYLPLFALAYGVWEYRREKKKGR